MTTVTQGGEVEGLVERLLRRLKLIDGSEGPLVNLNGPEAADALQSQATELATLKQQLEMAVEHIEELTDLYKQEGGLEDQPQPEIRAAMAFLAQKDRV